MGLHYEIRWAKCPLLCHSDIWNVGKGGFAELNEDEPFSGINDGLH